MKSHFVHCLGARIDSDSYPESAHTYLSSFPDLILRPNLCAELDRVWDESLSRHGKLLSEHFFAEYYTHPVWCLNSVFSGVDPTSVRIREALIDFINSLRLTTVADMGGGYGVFLKMLKKRLPEIRAILCEPYISKQVETALRQRKIETSVNIPLDADAYVFIDVLEHLARPLCYLSAVIKNAPLGSIFIFGNCFYPVIKCHLRSTFYLRHTFVVAARLMGLRYAGRVKGADYIQVFRLDSHLEINPWIVAVLARTLSILVNPIVSMLNLIRQSMRSFRRLIN